jgi:DNA-binding XRE family transcriptional regulator
VPATRELRAQLKQFGGNVRRTRCAVGLTQEKLAEMADLNIRTIRKIEAGDINILVTTAMRIQRALRCSWSSLFS